MPKEMRPTWSAGICATAPAVVACDGPSARVETNHPAATRADEAPHEQRERRYEAGHEEHGLLLRHERRGEGEREEAHFYGERDGHDDL